MPTSHEAFREETRELSLLIQAGDARQAARRPATPPKRGLLQRVSALFAARPAAGPAASAK